MFIAYLEIKHNVKLGVMNMKKIIHTDTAPKAIGTYSQAVSIENLTFISGQIPLDPETMNIVDGDFKDRAHRVFKNLSNIAKAGGGSLDDAIKVSIFSHRPRKFRRSKRSNGSIFSGTIPCKSGYWCSIIT